MVISKAAAHGSRGFVLCNGLRVTISLLTLTKRIVYRSYQKGGSLMQAYCMKCRAKREMKDAKSITMKNGKPATQGVCPVCGTKMFRIGKA